MKGKTRQYSAARMVELVNKDPDITNKQLAEDIGVTRQRVSQLRKQLNLPPAPSRKSNWHPCPNCGKLMRERKKYCSIACRHGQEMLVCETCGKEFGRSKRLVDIAKARNYEHTWCSKACQGTWFGNLKRRLRNLVN